MTYVHKDDKCFTNEAVVVTPSLPRLQHNKPKNNTYYTHALYFKIKLIHKILNNLTMNSSEGTKCHSLKSIH